MKRNKLKQLFHRALARYNGLLAHSVLRETIIDEWRNHDEYNKYREEESRHDQIADKLEKKGA